MLARGIHPGHRDFSAKFAVALANEIQKSSHIKSKKDAVQIILNSQPSQSELESATDDDETAPPVVGTRETDSDSEPSDQDNSDTDSIQYSESEEVDCRLPQCESEEEYSNQGNDRRHSDNETARHVRNVLSQIRHNGDNSGP